MRITSFGAVAGLLLLAACGGNEFSAATGSSSGGEGGVAAGTGGDGTGGMLGSTGGAGVTMGGSGGAVVGVIDASMTGAGGQLTVDAGHHPDASTGSGGATIVDASADVRAADTGVVPTCPSTEPGGGGMCSGALKCTYGTHPRIACRRTYTCSAGQWAVGASAMCTDLGLCTNENPLPHIGGTCGSVGHDCVWDTGLYCRCLMCPDTSCPQWNCFPPPNGCGTTPPNLGQPCDATTLPGTCDYGNCALGSRVIVTCVNGAINWTFPNCQ